MVTFGCNQELGCQGLMDSQRMAAVRSARSGIVRKTCGVWTRKLAAAGGENLKRMSSASGRSDRSGPGRPATTRAEPDGAAGGGSAATRGPDVGGPRCDGMAAGGSRGHAQAIPQFSMPVSCRGQLLAGGQTANECSDGKRDRHGPRPARDREWVGPLAAGGRKCGPGGSYHCSGMDAAGVAAVCQSYGSQRD